MVPDIPDEIDELMRVLPQAAIVGFEVTDQWGGTSYQGSTIKVRLMSDIADTEEVEKQLETIGWDIVAVNGMDAKDLVIAEIGTTREIDERV